MRPSVLVEQLQKYWRFGSPSAKQRPLGRRTTGGRRRSLVRMTADRSLIARLAAHELWARTADPSARTAPARRALLDRFEREVDPDGALPVEERRRRTAMARQAYFARLAGASARARKRAAEVRPCA